MQRGGRARRRGRSPSLSSPTSGARHGGQARPARLREGRKGRAWRRGRTLPPIPYKRDRARRRPSVAGAAGQGCAGRGTAAGRSAGPVADRGSRRGCSRRRCGATSERGTGPCTTAGATQAAGDRRSGQRRGGSARVGATGNEGGAGPRRRSRWTVARAGVRLRSRPRRSRLHP